MRLDLLWCLPEVVILTLDNYFLSLYKILSTILKSVVYITEKLTCIYGCLGKEDYNLPLFLED